MWEDNSYNANEESDDVIGGSTKQYNTQSRISLEILKQCSSNLAPEMCMTKERMTPFVGTLSPLAGLTGSLKVNWKNLEKHIL